MRLFDLLQPVYAPPVHHVLHPRVRYVVCKQVSEDFDLDLVSDLGLSDMGGGGGRAGGGASSRGASGGGASSSGGRGASGIRGGSGGDVSGGGASSRGGAGGATSSGGSGGRRMDKNISMDLRETGLSASDHSGDNFDFDGADIAETAEWND